MAKKQTGKIVASKTQRFEVMPSEEVIIEHFRACLNEYLTLRSLKGIQPFFDKSLTAFGAADNEICSNHGEALAVLKRDLQQFPGPIKIFNDTLAARRFNDFTAVLWGQANLCAETDNTSHAIRNIRVTVVYNLIDGKLLISHLHVSVPQTNGREEPDSWPIRKISDSTLEAAEKYRLIFDNSPIGILHYDINGIVKDCNQKFLQIIGTTREKIAGLDMLKLPDRKASECIGSALKGHNGHYEGYYSSVTVNKVTPIKVLATPIISADSKITGGIAIFEDISEHRVTQDRLQYQFQLERLISNIAQSLVSAPLDQIDRVIENALCLSGRFFGADRGYVFQVDTGAKTITNTHEWCEANIESLMPKYQAYPLGKLPGILDFPQHSIEYFHFADVNTMSDEMAEFRKLLIEDNVRSILLLPLLVQGKFIGLFGYDCVQKSRSWPYEEISLLKVIAEMFSNALAKKATEKQLRKSEERYRLVAENINDIIWIVDLEIFHYTYMSPSVSRILGYTPQELMQHELTHTLTPESIKTMIDSVPERLDNLRNNRQTHYVDEVEQISKDGSLILTEITTNWIFNPITQHAEVIGITRDITERKEAEEHKRQIEVHRQQSLKADSLGRMAGAIAHHFNNQLQVVLGNLELLAREKQVEGKPLRSISDAMRATHKAAEISTLMLSYLGQQQLESQSLRLYELCHSQLDTLREHLPSGHELKLLQSKTDVTINANRNRLVQVLKNLVINASESYGNETGKILISVSMVKSKEIPHTHRFPIAWTPEHDLYGCLKVQDNGSGIAEDDLSKIFDPFYTTKFAGRGLGLANALGCMRSIGGGITVSSKPDQGSSFCFYFPCVENMQETKKSTEKVPKLQPLGQMVLVVEDEEMVRLITRSLLENFNYKVIDACNGKKAIEVFNALRDQIDLVICDLVMPDMDGWQTLEELRKISPELPVILASGYDQSFVMKGEHKEQPQVFLSKPFNSSSLQEAIKQALANKLSRR